MSRYSWEILTFELDVVTLELLEDDFFELVLVDTFLLLLTTTAFAVVASLAEVTVALLVLDELLLVDFAVVFAVVFLTVEVDCFVVTTLTCVFKVDFAVVFFIDEDFFDDFLLDVVLWEEVECLVLETALSTNSTSQELESQRPSKLQQSPKPEPTQVTSVPQVPSVETEGELLLATAEASNRAKVEMAENLPIFE